jgi:hypothetical protein
MAVSNVIERLGRAIFEAPFGGQKISKDAPELAEIRLAVMDAVKAKAHRAGGKLVFPYNLIRIKLAGVPEEQAAVFRSAFLADYFAEELRAGLGRSSYRYPADLTVEIETLAEMPGPKEGWLAVETLLREAPTAAVPSGAEMVASLTVIKGRAQPAELRFAGKTVNVGRTEHVVQESGPSRLNDIAFAEEDAIGRSVSRQHAHFECVAGEVRVFNDRVYKGADNCSLYVVRAGKSQPVHRGGHGAVLVDGDEIHLGQAVIRFGCTTDSTSGAVLT